MASSKVAFQFRLDEDAHQKAKQIATQEFRSLNAQLEYFIVKGIEQYERENGEIPPEDTE